MDPTGPILVLAYLACPVLVLWACARFSLARKVGAVILCYLIGIAVGNSGLPLEEGARAALGGLQDVTVGLALPLLLLSSNVRRWVPIAGRALTAFGFACLGVALCTGLGGLSLIAGRPDAWQLGGMSMAVYSGGTPNLAAVTSALEIPGDTFVIFHTYDTLVSLAYIVFMASLAQRLLRPLLGAYRPRGGAPDAAGLQVEDLAAFRDMLARRRLGWLAVALLAAAVMMAAAYGAGLLVPAGARTAVSVLALTSLGIGASLIPRLHRIERTFQLGFYLLMVFCLAVGTQARLDSLVNIQWDLLAFVGVVIFGSLTVQIGLCRLLRIDVDTCLVTHVSAICSPPFVPVVTTGLKNQELLPVGMTTGIVGYALGNYLGIGLAYALRAWTG